ncbi:MAG: RNA methyltransferase [Thermoplasmata archaeon]|nr:RNA methyltransferase [Thermoplasmata archaeon]
MAEPKNEGNVGAVARAMMNFGVEDLILVNPCEIGVVAEKRAMRAIEILKSARTYETLEEALKEVDFVVGTSGVDTASDRRFIRIALGPDEASAKLAEMDGKVGLLFGREDFGLLNPELMKCDMLIRIPSSEDYPILNLSHAVSVVLYELFKPTAEKRERRKASGHEKEKLQEHFVKLLDAINYPEHKMERTKMMFRRLMGRATPSKWEFHALMGVIGEAAKRLDKES